MSLNQLIEVRYNFDKINSFANVRLFFLKTHMIIIDHSQLLQFGIITIT